MKEKKPVKKDSNDENDERVVFKALLTAAGALLFGWILAYFFLPRGGF